MGDFIGSMVKVLTAIIVVAIIAALVSKKANTTSVIKSAGSTFDWLVKTIVSPISGSSASSSISALGGLGSMGSFALPSASAGTNSYSFTL